MNIRQCIPADRALVSDFLKSLGGSAPVEVTPFELRLSLIASEGDAIRGVALFRSVAGSSTRELAIAVAADNPSLLQLVMDKALTKLHSQGIHKCTVTLLHREEPQAVWNQSRWAGTQPPSESNDTTGETGSAKKPAKTRKAKTEKKVEPAAAA